MPDVQLALVGSMASDDPEGWDFFNATVAHADGDTDIHILNNFNNVGAIEVNAFQSHADVLIQKSTREGFGLTVSEAIWKARPFIGGDVGGIPLQIQDGVTGFLVASVEECAERALEILEDPELGQGARQARQGVRAHALPHAALPARLSAHLHRAERRMSERDRHSAPPLVLVSNRGPVTFHAGGEIAARHRRPRDRADGPRLPPRSDLDRLGDDRARRARSREHGGRAFPVRSPGGGEYQVRLVRQDAEAYDRFYNVFANPMLWFIQHYLWDLSNAPDIRREEIEAFEFGYNVVNEDLARAVVEEIEGIARAGRDGPRLPPLHAARARARAHGPTCSCTTSSTSRGRSRTPGACCRRASARRSSPACSPTTSSASTPAPTGATSCSAAAT